MKQNGEWIPQSTDRSIGRSMFMHGHSIRFLSPSCFCAIALCFSSVRSEMRHCGSVAFRSCLLPQESDKPCTNETAGPSTDMYGGYKQVMFRAGCSAAQIFWQLWRRGLHRFLLPCRERFVLYRPVPGVVALWMMGSVRWMQNSVADCCLSELRCWRCPCWT